TWSAITQAYGALNRHELPATAPDWINVDYRRLTTIEAGEITPYLRAAWGDMRGISIYVEAMHRLSNLGAVITYWAHGTSQQGFAAEWRDIAVFTVQEGRINRCEIFDEADLDAALARFEELQPRSPRVENAASQATERLSAKFV